MAEQQRTPAGMRVITRDEWGPDQGLLVGGTWREIVGPQSGAECRGLYDAQFTDAGTSRTLCHTSEAAYYVVDGAGAVVHGTSGDSQSLVAGSMVHVRPGTPYQLKASEGTRIVGGPCPAESSITGAPVAPAPASEVWPDISVHHRDHPGLLVPFISQDARLVVWLGIGAVAANMNYVVLQPGERNKEHVHAYSEDTIHILEGRGTAENVTTGERLQFGPGDTIHIEIGFWHAVAADRGERVVSVGGPCPADVDMLRAAGVDVDQIDLPPGTSLPAPGGVARR
ncbi:cupin domain-containing protein [Mycobacterium sp. 236(2023)]|uniref:cupin domain-containing protein n=1 Tax=Mycobacterium sp. 236(2023) TaxID=3038163 RepID=UPI002414D217|nr:cupin domain-containing protein [Mycobacterium sp. 236(2023)]MDG4669287.1 cupin domain-containing protein [Mycobacterium sp. 236(2023)]